MNVFEVGFGTGLNAFLSAQYAEEKVVRVNYHSIEAFPVEVRIVKELNYIELIDYKIDVLNSIQSVKWEEEIAISKTFSPFFMSKISDQQLKKLSE